MSLHPYLTALIAGLCVGAFYALIGTRSPATPIIALLGLLGILLGEPAVSWAKERWSVREAAAHCLHSKSFEPGAPKGEA